MNDTKYLKAINFDLVVKELKQHYPGAHYTKAYKDIKEFMLANNFTHRQGSGYVSNKPMSVLDMYDFVDKLKIKLPWIAECVRKIDVTNIGQQYDLTPLINKVDEKSTPIVKPPKGKGKIATQIELAKSEAYKRNSERAKQNTPQKKDIPR